jgi:hypothetical protein
MQTTLSPSHLNLCALQDEMPQRVVHVTREHVVSRVMDVEPQRTQTVLVWARRAAWVAGWLAVTMVLLWPWLEEIPATWSFTSCITDLCKRQFASCNSTGESLLEFQSPSVEEVLTSYWTQDYIPCSHEAAIATVSSAKGLTDPIL